MSDPKIDRLLTHDIRVAQLSLSLFKVSLYTGAVIDVHDHSENLAALLLRNSIKRLLQRT